jgi:hypothetical protein
VFHTSGRGGYGPPFERSLSLLKYDIEEGWITKKWAAEICGNCRSTQLFSQHVGETKSKYHFRDKLSETDGLSLKVGWSGTGLLLSSAERTKENGYAKDNEDREIKRTLSRSM